MTGSFYHQNPCESCCLPSGCWRVLGSRAARWKPAARRLPSPYYITDDVHTTRLGRSSSSPRKLPPEAYSQDQSQQQATKR